MCERMEYKLTIPHMLPNLNNYIAAERAHWRKAANMKEEEENKIIAECRTQLRGVRITKPVFIRYLWVEKNEKRDRDNIAFAKKFIQDALIGAGVLKNDGWKEITGFRDDFIVDKKKPRVEVTIIERE